MAFNATTIWIVVQLGLAMIPRGRSLASAAFTSGTTKGTSLNQKIDAFIAANKEQWLKDIEALVSINSVESTPAEGAPFGQGARAALDKTLELAAGMGFATRNCENYIGYAEPM